MAALDAWLEASGISEGAIFRPVDRHGRVHNARLSGEAVSIVVRERVAAAGLDQTGYSGHSLRAGLATSAAQAGVPSLAYQGANPPRLRRHAGALYPRRGAFQR